MLRKKNGQRKKKKKAQIPTYCTKSKLYTPQLSNKWCYEFSTAWIKRSIWQRVNVQQSTCAVCVQHITCAFIPQSTTYTIQLQHFCRTKRLLNNTLTAAFSSLTAAFSSKCYFLEEYGKALIIPSWSQAVTAFKVLYYMIFITNKRCISIQLAQSRWTMTTS